MAGLGFPGWWWRAAGRLGKGGRTIGATWSSRPALPRLWRGVTGRKSFGRATSLDKAKAAFRADYEAWKGTE
jgi:hypothetical protein